MGVLELNNVTKVYKVLNRRPGLEGSIKDLFSRDYKYIHAVDDINLKIEQGEIVGYLGPNGAGKSTTIKMMTGVLTPTSGNVLVSGYNPYKERRKCAQEIGVVFGQRSQLWWALPVIESFKILKEIYRTSDLEYNDNLRLFDEIVGVSKLYSKPVRELSLGQRTLCDILAAFLHNPQIVFLDEPTIGLDVVMKSRIRTLIKFLNEHKKTTVILTTHDIGDVDAMCDRTILIDGGKILFDDSIEMLRKYFGAYRTLKLFFNDFEENVITYENDVINIIKGKYGDTEKIKVMVGSGYIGILFDESEIAMLDILDSIQSKMKIDNISIDDISTENVIQNIYEGMKKNDRVDV